MRNEQLLLVDDEKGILTMLETLLRKEGFQRIMTATTAAEALQYVKTSSAIELILLDVMLPDMDGFELCQQIRKLTSVPILFVSARTGDLDKVMGLGFGGDDYITKPFHPMEVVARVNAQLRRHNVYKSKPRAKPQLLDFGVFAVNKGSGQLLVNGAETACPAKEFELLTFLCEHPNQVFTAMQLYDQVWGTALMGDEKTVVIHISRLRKKIELDAANPRIIVNIRGIGYRFMPPSNQGDAHES
ncbi:response regulator transcription factor [Paenibacillus sp. NEAU-GSW1]|uniref:response regulator transcription factor n=1 Tax=Paenibacillus sp. NEAU-GSW1 TaxID=2682486 RepID=UPI0012E14DA5|nr:response regulator transcription factor [Paenibacillus sp. NEAU-GSW1]MUT66987.1 response regulator [Paenibacillus sp. NEAU-GSW1]